MIGKKMRIGYLIILATFLSALCLADDSVTGVVEKWDFEDKDIGNWQVHDSSGKSKISVDTFLKDSCSLRLNYDDYLQGNFFEKGFKINLDSPLGWKDFSSISFLYHLTGPAEEIVVSFVTEEENWWTLSKEIKEERGEFSLSTNEFLKNNPYALESKIKEVYIFTRNKKPLSKKSRLNLSFAIDDITFSFDFSRLPISFSSDKEYPFYAIAAERRNPIKIDGKLTKKEWAGAVPVVLTELNQISKLTQEKGGKWEGPSDLSAVVMLLWDNKYLYFGTKVRDDKMVCTQPNYMKSGNDCIRFFLRTSVPPSEKQDKLGSQDYAFYISPFGAKGKKPLLAFPRYGPFKKGTSCPEERLHSVKIASSLTRYGYATEMAVAWKALKRTPKEGRRMGFFTFIDDSDKESVSPPGIWKQQINWRKIDVRRCNYWQDASCWGKLFLTGKLTDKEAVSIAAATGSIKITTDKEQYKTNENLIGKLDLYFPLIAKEGKINWQVADDKGKARGNLIPSPTAKAPLSTQFSARWNTKRNPDGDYLLLANLNKEIFGSTSIKLFGMKTEEREKNRINAKESLILLSKKGKEKNELSCKRPISAYINRVEPSKWSLVKDPVTWEDLGGGFVGSIQNAMSQKRIDIYTKHYDFGCFFRTYSLNQAWEEAAQLNLKATICSHTYGRTGQPVPIERHRRIRKIMGRRFLGYEVGEQDGYYIAAIASGYMPASRQEAQKLFWDWHEKEHNAPTHHFLTYLGSMNFPHQFGAMGYRMVGYEDSQVLPSTMMRWAFLRGAGKQYGLLSYTLISIFNRFGHKNYLKSGKGRSAHYDYGPDKGPSLSLLKRLYYVIFMYGAASSGFEVPDIACVTNEKDKEGYPKLSPLGEINVKGVEWCRKYGEKRGIQYAPVALLIDFASGWVPPKHFAAPGNRYLVWGNMPYKKGDYQIDNFFRWVYPQYEDCAYFKDERGYLTPTPFGDKFDVLTSDVQEHILGQYSVICLLGEIDLTPSLIKMLKGFVKKGGTIILSAEDARGFGSSFSGLSIGSRREGYGSLSLFDRKIFKEKDYIYTEVTPKKAKVLAVNEDKLPLITLSDYGKGRVVVLTPDYWMTDRLKVGDLAHRDVHPARYELLNVVKHVLGKYFKDLDLVRVDGSKIQYIVNLTKDDKSLLLTLVNNDKETDWEGTISLKDGKIVSIREWMEGKQLSVRRPIKVKVPRGDLRVFKITSDKPLFYQKKY